MYPKSEYRNLSPHYSTNSATPPYISTYGTLYNTRLLIDKTKKNNISPKIFKTLFFKIYNPTFNKIYVPHKTLFQNTSHHKPQHNFNTSFPCTTIFSPETKTATINLIRLSEFYFTP